MAVKQQRQKMRRPCIDPGDGVLQGLAILSALGLLLLVFLIGLQIWRAAGPSLTRFGWSFIFSRTWDPVAGVFGALPYIYGTLITTLLGLILAAPLSLGAAIFLAELAPRPLRTVLGFLVDMLAAIPSIVYGLWGNFVLAPWLLRFLEPWLGQHFGWLPLFQGPMYGTGILAAAIILAIMISPLVTAISREVLALVPTGQREALQALGATPWEVVRVAVLPSARTGIIGAFTLGLGKALGETMAVTLVIGNRPEISWSLFAPAHTMTSVIINEFAEAITSLHVAALIHIALLLFLVTLLVNILARLLIYRMERGGKDGMMHEL